MLGSFFSISAKKVTGETELELRVHRVGTHQLLGVVEHDARRASAVIANSVQVHHFGFVGNVLPVDRGHPDREVGRQRFSVDSSGIVVREIGEQAASIRRLPPEELVGECGEFVRPEQLLGHEIVHA